MGWMVVEGVNLYAVVVIVLGVDMERRLKLYYAFAWGECWWERGSFIMLFVCSFSLCLSGIPAIIVALTIGIAGPATYGSSSSL